MFRCFRGPPRGLRAVPEARAVRAFAAKPVFFDMLRATLPQPCKPRTLAQTALRGAVRHAERSCEQRLRDIDLQIEEEMEALRQKKS